MTATAACRAPEVGTAARWREAVDGAWAVPAVREGTLGSCFILVGSLTPAFLPADNAFDHVWLLRELQHGAGRVLATAVLLFGVLILLRAWLRLHPRDDGVDVSRATLALWGLPLLLAPPLFSSDAYSYAAQGRIVHLGFDPYALGPGLLGGQFAEQVDPLWLWTPAPYGPLALQIQHAVVDLMGSNPYASAVGMRLPAIAALVVIATLLPRIATALGRDPRFALWLGVLNPLTVLHLLGGAHNDVIMIALVVVALWLATQRRLVLASLAVALAAAVKQPALVAVVAVGLLCAPTPPPSRQGAWTRERLVHVATATAVALVGFAVTTAATGLGYGWIGAMHVPGQVRTYLAPSTGVGSLLELLLRLTGHQVGAGLAVPVMRVVGLLAGALIVGWLVLRRAPRQPVTVLVLMFLAIVVAAPSLHPWYVLWAACSSVSPRWTGPGCGSRPGSRRCSRAMGSSTSRSTTGSWRSAFPVGSRCYGWRQATIASSCTSLTRDDLTGPGPSWCTRPHRCRCAEPGRMRCWRSCRSPRRCRGRRLRARTPIFGCPPVRLRQPSRSRHGDRSGTGQPLHGMPGGRDLDPFAWTPLRERVFIMGSITRITWMSGRPLIGRSGRRRPLLPSASDTVPTDADARAPEPRSGASARMHEESSVRHQSIIGRRAAMTDTRESVGRLGLRLGV